MRRLAIVFLLATTIVACRDGPTSVEPELGDDIDLEVGECVVFRGEGFSILFREVVSDSRCPEGVMCVWAGNAKIRIEVAPLARRGPAEHVFELNTYLEPKQGAYSIYTVQLVSLEPYPHIDRPIPDDAYVATLRVTRSDAD